MRRLYKVLIGLAVAIVLLAGGVYAGWYFFLKADTKPRAEIKQTAVVEGGALDGNYQVAPGDPQSFVGYRVVERFGASPLESTATGRTSEMNGSFTIEGRTIKDVQVTANLLSLKSDRDARDDRIKTLGLDSERFPESRFVLTEPLDFDSAPKAGETVRAVAVGDFTLHGVTRHVRIPVEGRWDGRDVQVIGNLHIKFADYQMEAPNIAGLVTVKDEGEMEFQIFFRKS
jgi:polyisoprenoid-binding protein YceI